MRTTDHIRAVSFDALAPHYRWMEWLLAGGKLQRCRTAFLAHVRHARNAVLLGEGNGRFLGAFAAINRSAQITVVDASEGMLHQAQRRAARDHYGLRRIHYVHADILEWTPPLVAFDLIVTNFFFDCFREDQLAALLPRLAPSASVNAQWIVSDFRVPPQGPARWRAQGIVAAMYCFFRVATRLPASGLPSVAPMLEGSGFRLREREFTEWGLLYSELWQRGFQK